MCVTGQEVLQEYGTRVNGDFCKDSDYGNKVRYCVCGKDRCNSQSIYEQVKDAFSYVTLTLFVPPFKATEYNANTF